MHADSTSSREQKLYVGIEKLQQDLNTLTAGNIRQFSEDLNLLTATFYQCVDSQLIPEECHVNIESALANLQHGLQQKKSTISDSKTDIKRTAGSSTASHSSTSPGSSSSSTVLSSDKNVVKIKLQEAVTTGNLQTLDAELKKVTSHELLEFKYVNGCNLLHFAVEETIKLPESVKIEMIKSINKYCPQLILLANNYGHSPLYIACIFSSTDLVHALCQNYGGSSVLTNRQAMELTVREMWGNEELWTNALKKTRAERTIHYLLTGKLISEAKPDIKSVPQLSSAYQGSSSSSSSTSSSSSNFNSQRLFTNPDMNTVKMKLQNAITIGDIQALQTELKKVTGGDLSKLKYVTGCNLLHFVVESTRLSENTKIEMIKLIGKHCSELALSANQRGHTPFDIACMFASDRLVQALCQTYYLRGNPDYNILRDDALIKGVVEKIQRSGYLETTSSAFGRVQRVVFYLQNGDLLPEGDSDLNLSFS
jgi:ankyrin repeat protein